MPKLTDHEERRNTIAGALLRLAARDGLEAVSFRTVAAECGISPGAVQKYFATKDDIIMRAVGLTEQRLEARYARLPADAGVAAQVRQALPLDQQRREETTVLTAFTARAASRRDWAEYLAEGYATIHATTTTLIRMAQHDGAMRPDRDPAELADALISLSDGFALRLLLLPANSPEAARMLRSLETAIDTLLQA